LLKTRAGENVVALMTAITSILNETSCTTILSHLFETAGVSLDNTPGIGELGKLREALLSFTRKTEFGEKVLQYHYLLQAFGQGSQTTPGHMRNPYEAIPHNKDIPTILQMLFKVTSTQGLIFTYKGITGAAWVATYASFVLGLPTCAIDASGRTLPVNGTYEEARVVIRISSLPLANTCETSRTGNLEDFISLESEGLERKGWSVDCLVVNFLDVNCPELRKMPDFPVLYEFAAVEMLNVISRLADNFSYPNHRRNWTDKAERTDRLCKYTLYVLAELRTRGLRILEILGFVPGTLDDYTFEARRGCPDYYCVGLRREPLDPEAARNILGFSPKGSGSSEYTSETGDLEDSAYPEGGEWSRSDGRANYREALSRLEEYIQNRFLHRMSNMADDGDGQYGLAFMKHPSSARQYICRVVINAVDIAARLAFSDWSASFTSLSVRHFYQAGTTNNDKPADLHLDDLISAVILCTDNHDTNTLEQKFITLDWAGIDFDGIVVLRSIVAEHSILGLGGRFLDFRLGRIVYENSSVRSIRVETIDTDQIQTLEVIDDCSQTTGPELRPCHVAGLEPVELRRTFSVTERTLWLRLEFLTRSKKWVPANPIGISYGIPHIYYTTPCTHYQQMPLMMHGMHGMHRSELELPPSWPTAVQSWGSISIFDEPEFIGPVVQYSPIEHARLRIAYSHVIRTAEGQWLSCTRDPINGKGLPFEAIILQKNTCLLCTVHTVVYNYRWRVFIIPCQDDTTKTPNDALTTPNFRPCQNYQSVLLQTQLNTFPSKRTFVGSLDDLSRARVGRECPASLHTPCCIKKNEEPCQACVPPMCRDDSDCPPCESCKGTFSLYSDLIKELKAEWKDIEVYPYVRGTEVDQTSSEEERSEEEQSREEEDQSSELSTV
ncbi:MAG: hypothetical protein Q9187_004929, partial [Circinaria calcarea]